MWEIFSQRRYSQYSAYQEGQVTFGLAKMLVCREVKLLGTQYTETFVGGAGSLQERKLPGKVISRYGSLQGS